MDRPYHHGSLREALLAAAEVILERDGVEALTLRGAAREAGVTHGSPAHHFGDLQGLLSELAANGFIRFHEQLRIEAAGADPHSQDRVVSLSRGYVRFARDSPGLFQLMFRSALLDWSRPALAAAGAEAFALLMEENSQAPSVEIGVDHLTTMMARWSLVHGLSMLLIDGRFQAVSEKAPGLDIESFLEGVLARGV